MIGSEAPDKIDNPSFQFARRDRRLGLLARQKISRDDRAAGNESKCQNRGTAAELRNLHQTTPTIRPQRGLWGIRQSEGDWCLVIIFFAHWLFLFDCEYHYRLAQQPSPLPRRSLRLGYDLIHELLS